MHSEILYIIKNQKNSDLTGEQKRNNDNMCESLKLM